MKGRAIFAAGIVLVLAATTGSFAQQSALSARAQAVPALGAAAAAMVEPSPPSVSSPPALGLRLLGRWHYGPVYSSALSGDHVYFGSGGAIRVLEIKADGSWREKTSVSTAGVIRQLFVSGDHLYVADESGALRIMDISEPGRPMEIGHCDQPRVTRSVFVKGRYAYTAGGWAGLGVVDVSNPERPRPIGTFKIGGYAQDVHVRESLAFLAALRRRTEAVRRLGPPDATGDRTPGSSRHHLWRLCVGSVRLYGGSGR